MEELFVRIGEQVSTVGGERGRTDKSESADVEEDDGDDGCMMNGDMEFDGELIVVGVVFSKMARSQSSVLGGGLGVKVQTGKSVAMLLAEGVAGSAPKRPESSLVPPAAGTSHRPMKGTRRTPPVLGGEWKKILPTRKHLPTTKRHSKVKCSQTWPEPG